jgi:hypothetical protein
VETTYSNKTAIPIPRTGASGNIGARYEQPRGYLIPAPVLQPLSQRFDEDHRDIENPVGRRRGPHWAVQLLARDGA